MELRLQVVNFDPAMEICNRCGMYVCMYKMYVCMCVICMYIYIYIYMYALMCAGGICMFLCVCMC